VENQTLKVLKAALPNESEGSAPLQLHESSYREVPGANPGGGIYLSEQIPISR